MSCSVSNPGLRQPRLGRPSERETMALLEPTNLLLMACELIYGLIGEAQEALILLAFVVAICQLDGWQQHRSRRALAELSRLSSPRARVRRGGIDLELPPEEAHVGDLLRLEEGDRVVADAQLREGVGLWMDTSLLTGNSLPNAVDKTGTLTENRMAVQQLLSWPAGELWCAGAPLKEPWHRLLELAVAQLQQSEHLHPDWPMLREYPLSPDLLVFSQLWRTADGGWQIAAKGAPEAIAQLCHLPRSALPPSFAGDNGGGPPAGGRARRPV
jgi:hypothetical protein